MTVRFTLFVAYAIYSVQESFSALLTSKSLHFRESPRFEKTLDPQVSLFPSWRRKIKPLELVGNHNLRKTPKRLNGPPFRIVHVRSPPMHIVQGEIFSIQVFLHTSLQNDSVDAFLSFVSEEFDQFESITKSTEVEGETGQCIDMVYDDSAVVRQVTIAGNTNEPTLVDMKISLKTFGARKLFIRVYNDNYCTSRNVTVITRPRGILHTTRKFDLVNFLDKSNATYRKTVSPANLPSNRIVLQYKHNRNITQSKYWSATESLRFVTSLDALSLAIDVPYKDLTSQTQVLQKLDEIFPLPSGTFEYYLFQMMTSELLLEHLSSLSQLSLETKAHLIQRLGNAYKNLMLTYKSTNGSFTSSFGTTEEPVGARTNDVSKILPTAIVTHTLLSVAKYISVDRCTVEKALAFLANHQKEDGSFPVANNNNGTDGSASYIVTARVLNAFGGALKIRYNQEYRCGDTFIRNNAYSIIIQKGANYLVGFINYYRIDLQDSYPLSVIANFFSEINHPKADMFFYALRLSEVRISDSGYRMLHWESKEAPVALSEFNSILYQRSLSRHITSVETASYALMTYLKQNRITESFEIVRWLIQHRDKHGVGSLFHSFTDTTAALRALAAFGNTVYNLMDRVDFALNVTYDDYLAPGYKSLITKRDPVVVFDELKQLDSYFGFQASDWELGANGSSSAAFVSLTWSYLLEPKDYSSSYDLLLNAHVESFETGKFLDIQTCMVNAYVPASGNTGAQMNVMEVETPSGYKFDYENLQYLLKYKKGHLKSFVLEKDETKLTLYIEAIPYKKSCMDLRANRFHEIGNLYVGTALVYDFFDTSRKAQVFFSVPTISTALMKKDTIVLGLKQAS